MPRARLRGERGGGQRDAGRAAVEQRRDILAARVVEGDRAPHAERLAEREHAVVPGVEDRLRLGAGERLDAERARHAHEHAVDPVAPDLVAAARGIVRGGVERRLGLAGEDEREPVARAPQARRLGARVRGPRGTARARGAGGRRSAGGTWARDNTYKADRICGVCGCVIIGLGWRARRRDRTVPFCRLRASGRCCPSPRSAPCCRSGRSGRPRRCSRSARSGRSARSSPPARWRRSCPPGRWARSCPRGRSAGSGRRVTGSAGRPRPGSSGLAAVGAAAAALVLAR